MEEVQPAFEMVGAVGDIEPNVVFGDLDGGFRGVGGTCFIVFPEKLGKCQLGEVTDEGIGIVAQRLQMLEVLALRKFVAVVSGEKADGIQRLISGGKHASGADDFSETIDSESLAECPGGESCFFVGIGRQQVERIGGGLNETEL